MSEIKEPESVTGIVSALKEQSDGETSLMMAQPKEL
jgi:hypothetical protein